MSASAKPERGAAGVTYRKAKSGLPQSAQERALAVDCFWASRSSHQQARWHLQAQHGATILSRSGTSTNRASLSLASPAENSFRGNATCCGMSVTATTIPQPSSGSKHRMKGQWTGGGMTTNQTSYAQSGFCQLDARSAHDGHLLPVASDRFQVVYSSIPGTKLTTQQRSPGRQRFDRGDSRRIVRPIDGQIANAQYRYRLQI
jgi:hypothetical protein